MPKYSTENIRNLALVGHAGCGKTSLTEALLKQMGAIHETGDVTQGTTVSDHTDEEKRHGHSLHSSIVHGDHNGIHINLIDTPGMLDFLGHTYTALPAVETVAVVINAHNGIEPMTRRMMQVAKERGLCRMIIINRIDMDNVDLPGLLEQIKETFGSECLPLNLPSEGHAQVIDCFTNTQGDSEMGPVSDFHTAIIDQVVEVDEALMAIYLEQGEELSPEQLHAPFEKALREGHLVPVCFTSARSAADVSAAVGMKQLLDLIEKLAPNPMEGNPQPFYRGQDQTEPFHAVPDASQHLIAHVFSVASDPFVGKLCAMRIHQGTITPQSQVFVDDPDQGELKKAVKPGHLYKLQGKQHVEIDAAVPGDICALAKLDQVHRDAVLHDSHDEDQIHYLPLPFPQSMYGLAITPTRRGDEQKLADALHRMIAEDPTFSVTRDSITHETVIHGLGELHLRVKLEGLKAKYNIEVDTKPPKVAYRETIRGKAEGHHRHKKQTGGAGQFGEVYLRIEPAEDGAGFVFSNDTFGGSIPQAFIPAIEKGVKQAMDEGVVAGYPMQDVKVSVYDGKHHPVDSKEIAFVAAAKRAFADAVSKAQPALLEPMVDVEVIVPNMFMGDVTGDLSGKRGRIQGTDMLPGDMSSITATVPLSEMMNYQNQLKSVTGGQGSFTMDFSHYEPVPGNVQQEIIAQYQPHHEDD